MRAFRYSCVLAPGVDFDLAEFTAEVDRILQDPKGWRRWGFSFDLQPTSLEPQKLRQQHGAGYFTIALELNEVIGSFGKSFDGMSVANCSENAVSLNYDRWTTGAKPNPGDPVEKMSLSDYRTYVVLHEVGHILSMCHPHDHKERESCAGGPAPVMLQQTNGVGSCTPNPWPLEGVDNVLAEEARMIHSDTSE